MIFAGTDIAKPWIQKQFLSLEFRKLLFCFPIKTINTTNEKWQICPLSGYEVRRRGSNIKLPGLYAIK